MSCAELEVEIGQSDAIATACSTSSNLGRIGESRPSRHETLTNRSSSALENGYRVPAPARVPPVAGEWHCRSADLYRSPTTENRGEKFGGCQLRGGQPAPVAARKSEAIPHYFPCHRRRRFAGMALPTIPRITSTAVVRDHGETRVARESLSHRNPGVTFQEPPASTIPSGMPRELDWGAEPWLHRAARSGLRDDALLCGTPNSSDLRIPMVQL